MAPEIKGSLGRQRNPLDETPLKRTTQIQSELGKKV